jgi:hypothetical protein
VLPGLPPQGLGRWERPREQGSPAFSSDGAHKAALVSSPINMCGSQRGPQKEALSPFGCASLGHGWGWGAGHAFTAWGRLFQNEGMLRRLLTG